MATQSHAASTIPAPDSWRRGAGRAAAAFGWSMLGRTLWRHKLFLACLVLSVLALTSLYVSQAPPVFEAETLVLIGERVGQAQAKDALGAPARAKGPESEALVFRSPAMAERLVDALNLHLLPEFNPTLRARTAGLREWFDPARLVPNSLFNSLPVVLREALSTRTAVSDQQQAASLRVEIAARTLDHIVAEPADRPSVVRVRFVSSDPRLAALGANTLAELYLADRLAAKQAVSIRAQAFLSDEVTRLRAGIAEAALQALQAEVMPGDAATTDAEALAHAAEADRDLLETYAARLEEIAALEQAMDPGARVISAATTPDQPVNPGRKLTFGAALFGALLVGSLTAFGLERLDNTITSVDQLGTPVLAPLGLLPPVPGPHDERRTPERQVLDYPDAPFAQAVSALRKDLVRASVKTRRTTVLLTSALAGEGTSTTAFCLARSHGRAGGSVLLIDCDLRKPRLHERTGTAREPGLADVLRGDLELEQVLHLDERSGAWFVTAGATATDPKQLLASEAMHRLVRQVGAAGYDLVILDGPPVLDGPQACILAQIADCSVLLARWGGTRREDVAAAARLLIEAGADMAGLVLNRAKAGRAAPV